MTKKIGEWSRQNLNYLIYLNEKQKNKNRQPPMTSRANKKKIKKKRAGPAQIVHPCID